MEARKSSPNDNILRKNNSPIHRGNNRHAQGEARYARGDSRYSSRDARHSRGDALHARGATRHSRGDARNFAGAPCSSGSQRPRHPPRYLALPLQRFSRQACNASMLAEVCGSPMRHTELTVNAAFSGDQIYLQESRSA